MISELLSFTGDQFTTSAITFLEKILERLYDFEEKKLDIWKIYWLEDYIHALETQKRDVIKGIVNNVNPIVVRIDKGSLILLLKEFEIRGKITEKNFLWAFVSLIKLAREKSMITFKEEDFFIEEIKLSRQRIEVFL